MASSLRERRKDGDTNIPVEGFSDIAFLLIIFFILTTTLQQPQGFLAELPAGEQSQEQTEQEDTPTVQLHENGITFQDKPITLPALRQKLKDLELADREEGERVVLLEASGEVGYELYYQAMAAITEAGGAVGIVREEDEGGGGGA
ncbi:MAG: biopolymer transporter ExbD [Phycisphaeraceae bacterium]|nr:biopolymer transporter ExbD [Phycisphaeraceae bacterium]